MWRAAFSLCSPAGAGGRLSIFIFHRVLPEADPLFPDEPDARRFSTLLDWIGRWFNVLPLTVAVDALKTAKLPARAAAITFDDGYADNFTVARPLLAAHGMCATFFIATGFLGGGRMWNDTVIEAVRRTPMRHLDLSDLQLGCHAVGEITEKRAAIRAIIDAIKYLPIAERHACCCRIAEISGASLPDDLMMRSAQVAAMRHLGMEIGGHTVTHPILARLDPAQARQEISEGKAFLENLLNEPIRLFAYPNGRPGSDYLPEHVAMVRDLGFQAAVSTAWGTSDRHTDPYQLRRFTPWDPTRTRFGIRLLRNFGLRSQTPV